MSHYPQTAAAADRAPRMSIGMPVFNGARFLRTALDALLAQTLGDFELIISDNASTDDTEAICRKYAARDERIRYCRQPVNRGAAWNFNHVFELARCPYFKWAAADDVCDPTFLARCSSVLDNDPSVVCCHGRSRKINAAGAALTDLDDPDDNSVIAGGGLLCGWLHGPHRRHPLASGTQPHRRFRDVLLSSGWGLHCYGVIRSDVLRQTSLIQPYYGYEKVMMAELALRGKIHGLSDVLLFERFHGQGSSQFQTVADQQRYFAPQRRKGRRFPRLRLLLGHFRAVSAAPISAYERAWCRVWIARYLLQLEKWPQVVHAALLGLPLGSPLRWGKAVASAPAAKDRRHDESSSNTEKNAPLRGPNKTGTGASLSR